MADKSFIVCQVSSRVFLSFKKPFASSLLITAGESSSGVNGFNSQEDTNPPVNKEKSLLSWLLLVDGRYPLVLHLKPVIHNLGFLVRFLSIISRSL